MKKIIIAVAIVASTFSCKKNKDIQAEAAPIKYYFKIQPVETDDIKNQTTTYKTITVN